MEKFLMANGCALRINDTQKGDKVLVLVHGYFLSLDIFEDVIKKLKQQYRIISFDVPGHGISETIGECHSMEFLADVVADILDQQKVEKCYIAGHSMGGYVATKFAQKYSERCEGLIMIHSIFEADNDEKKAFRQKEIDLIKAGKKELIAKINPGKAIAKHSHKKYADLIEDLEYQAIVSENEGCIALLNGMMQREDMKDFAKNTKTPVLCIWGKFDSFFPENYTENIENYLPNAKHVVMEQSGHMSFVEEEDKFIETIKEFMK